MSVIIDNNNITLGSASSTNFSVKLPYPRIIKKVTFKKLILPFTWYPIDSTNNILDFNDGTQQTANIVYASITSWTGASIATAIATAMNLVGGQTYTVSYSAGSNQITISSSASFSLNFASILSTYPNSTIYRILGFNPTNHTGAASYTSDYSCSLMGPNNILLKSTSLTNERIVSSNSIERSTGTNYYYTTKNNDTVMLEDQSVITTVPIQSSIGGLNVYDKHQLDTQYEYQQKIMTTIDFQFVNPWNNQVINNNKGNIIIELDITA